MLLAPQSTPFDLNFRLFGTEVRVNVSFWIFTAILGWSNIHQENGLFYLALWVVAVFLSILLHEFGHVLAGRLFGTNGYIVLYSFGGLAVGSNDTPVRWQRIVVSLAGPAIQLVLYGILWVLLKYVFLETILTWPEYAIRFYFFMMFINLLWPLFNLLPIWPLDGGMVSRELFEHFAPRTGLRNSLIMSAGGAALIAVNALLAYNGKPHFPYLPAGGIYTVILFAMLAVESYQLLQRVTRPWTDNRMPWEN